MLDFVNIFDDVSIINETGSKLVNLTYPVPHTLLSSFVVVLMPCRFSSLFRGSVDLLM